MKQEALNRVGYCGLVCDECFVYKQSISEAAKSLRRELRSAKLKDSWKDIPFLGDYEPFKRSLDGLAMLRCTKTCRGGGGNPWCKIRKCCQKKEFFGCWDCDDFENCLKLKEDYVKNLKTIKKSGLELFVSIRNK